MISFHKITLFFLLVFIKLSLFGQCAMCKAVLESNMQNGGTAGAGINNGIIYLMFIPYILIGTVGYFIYKHYKSNQKPEEV
tara:strand:- start:3509 stop:3751 length:243 start_codon:yes stop_codon:yes gene_type:complete